MGKELGAKGDYYDLLIALLEVVAEKYKIDEFSVRTDRELLEELRDISKKRRSIIGPAKYLSGGKWYEEE